MGLKTRIDRAQRMLATVQRREAESRQLEEERSKAIEAAAAAARKEEEGPPTPERLFAQLPVGPEGECFDFAQAPWVRAVLDWWLDPEVERILLLQASQTSKTTTMMGLLLYSAKFDPGPALWVGALEEEVGDFVVDRLKPFLEQADPDVRTGRKSDWRKTAMRLHGRMLTSFAWATSGPRLRAKPCRYVFGDECGVWPVSIPGIGDPMDYCWKRTRRWTGKGRKAMYATTPGSEFHPSWKFARQSAFARWHVPCPDCGHYQYLGFRKGITFTDCRTQDGRWDLERVEREACFECAACRARIPDKHKAGMILAGKLVYVDPADDYAELQGPPPGVPARTLQVPATYSLFTTWGQLARTFLEATQKGADSIRVFVTDELAEPYEEAGERPDLDAVRACIDEDRNPGALPHDQPVIGITCGVDVQEKRLYWVVRAFGYEDRSWMVAYGWIPREGDKSLDLLEPIIFIEYGGLPVNLALIDSGYDKDAVYNFCRGTNRRAVPSKGRAELADLVRLSPQDRRPDGRPDDHGLLLALVNVTHWKTVLHERIAVRQGEPREWRLHCDTADDYLVHMISEYRRPRPGRGPLQYDWVHDRRYPNHFFDCEVMALAAAKLMGWNFVQRPQEASERPKPRRSRRNPWAPESLGHLIVPPGG